jgi:ubiquitin-protein ligase
MTSLAAWQKRLEHERKKFPEFPLIPTEDPLIWHSEVIGPPGTPYKDKVFRIELKISKQYPFEAPYARFLTPIFHPNVHESGQFYCPLLLNYWSPSKTLQSIMLYIEDMLKHPDPAYKYGFEAATLLETDRAAFEEKAASYSNL